MHGLALGIGLAGFEVHRLVADGTKRSERRKWLRHPGLLAIGCIPRKSIKLIIIFKAHPHSAVADHYAVCL